MSKYSGRLPIYLVSLASIVLILIGIRAAASILNPILLAVVITITVLPIPGRLAHRGMPGWLALVLTILVVVLVLALVIMTVFVSVTKLAVELPSYMADAATTANQQLPPEITGSEAFISASQFSFQLGPVAQGVISTVVEIMVQFGLALFIFFFMISAAISLPGAERLGLDPRMSIVDRISTLTADIRHYMTILTGINFLVGFVDTVFLLILGVDYALLWGLLAWFMGYIPSIGFIIALIPPLLMAYAQYGLGTALVVLVGYVVINGGIQNFIQPKIMGQGLKINPLVVFVGLFVWGFLLGGMGAILAVPLTVLVLTIMENFDATRTMAILMRYTGEEKKEERQRAKEEASGLFNKVKATLQPSDEATSRDSDVVGS
jgi:predicted PurR-regulated permease PerM